MLYNGGWRFTRDIACQLCWLCLGCGPRRLGRISAPWQRKAWLWEQALCQGIWPRVLAPTTCSKRERSSLFFETKWLYKQAGSNSASPGRGVDSTWKYYRAWLSFWRELALPKPCLHLLSLCLLLVFSLLLPSNGSPHNQVQVSVPEPGSMITNN